MKLEVVPLIVKKEIYHISRVYKDGSRAIRTLCGIYNTNIVGGDKTEKAISEIEIDFNGHARYCFSCKHIYSKNKKRQANDN